MSETDGNDESLAAKKRKMLHDAQDSIAQLLKEIKHHRFLQYPLEDRIVQKKTEIKFAASREKSRRRGTSIVARGEPAIQQYKKVLKCAKKGIHQDAVWVQKKESKAIQPNTVTRERSCKNKAVGQYTPGTPNKEQKAPIPMSLGKTKTRGAKSGTAKNKRKILATAASSRPKRNKGIIKSLNQDALLPASDVEISSSHYSHSTSPFFPSDGSADTENSGEEGEVTNNLGKDMSDQPVVGKNTKKHGKKTQPLEEIIAKLTKKITADQVGETQTDNTQKQEPIAEQERNNGEDDGQDKAKAIQVEPNQINNITADQVGEPRLEDTKIQEPSGVEEEPSASDEKAEPSDVISDSDEDDGSDEETANPSEPNQSNKITAEQDGEPRTEDMKKKEASEEEDEPSDAISDSDEDDGADEETANPSQPNKTNKITADQVGEPRTKDQKKKNRVRRKQNPKTRKKGPMKRKTETQIGSYHKGPLSQGPTGSSDKIPGSAANNE
jgi:hypothetical protein